MRFGLGKYFRRERAASSPTCGTTAAGDSVGTGREASGASTPKTSISSTTTTTTTATTTTIGAAMTATSSSSSSSGSSTASSSISSSSRSSMATTATTMTTTATTATRDLRLPHPYQRAVRKKTGCVFYINHVTKSTSWLHPGRLAELREAGVVPPEAGTAERAVYDQMGLGSRGEAEWLSRGRLPPWVLREACESGGGDGGAAGLPQQQNHHHYWVDYRTGKMTLRDPVEAYREDLVLTAARRQRLEADIRNMGMGSSGLAADMRRKGWAGRAEIASDREIMHWL